MPGDEDATSPRMNFGRVTRVQLARGGMTITAKVGTWSILKEYVEVRACVDSTRRNAKQ